MKIQNGSFLSIEQLQDQYLKQKPVTEAKKETEFSFQEIFSQKQANISRPETNLRFSKHAAGRLADRNIELTNGQLERLQSGAKKAGEKGIQESLVVMDGLAFIVNIPNHTVITAMNQTETQDNVFTNIDGAVFI